MKNATRRKNFHLPLPEEIHARLRDEAKRRGQPATAIARHAIQSWLRQARRMELAESIAAYAAGHAGSDADLDPSLEAAGLEALRELEK
jgi:hypothetical protein